MHFYVVIAFATLFWRAERERSWQIVPANDVFWTLLAVWLQPVLLGLAAFCVAVYARKFSRRNARSMLRSMELHHRATFVLRVAMTVGFVGVVLTTPWTDWFAFGAVRPPLQILGDLLVLSPFFAECLLLWFIAFPFERRFRGAESDGSSVDAERAWGLGAYLDFNIRHHLLVVAVPMTIVLFAADLARGYESQLRKATGWMLAPEALLAVVAGAVFLFAPVMLRRIWRTTPLPVGPLREQLESLCARIRLRCRDILVWRSDGIMMNAAVMGIIPGVRYVLLSDALLASMSPRQIEAVFGHEAGHVRRRHIQHFLVFAFVGWLVVAGLMELLAWNSKPGAAWGLSFSMIEAVGVGATIVFWGLGFGWVSRRFERQADLFGARCVTPSEPECDRPCSVHLDAHTTLPHPDRVCATAAATFASALQKVAVLNGIPLEERSWRHSSIGSRIRFLNCVASDPARAVRFERTVRRIKTTMLAAAALGAAASLYYVVRGPELALLHMQASRPSSPRAEESRFWSGGERAEADIDDAPLDRAGGGR